MRRVVRFSAFAGAVLVLLPLCLTGRAMFTGGVYGPVDLAYTTEPLASLSEEAGVTRVVNPGVSDVYAEFFPWHDALRRVVREGNAPLWNRWVSAGNPLAAALQVAPYHPITLLSLLLSVAGAATFMAAAMFFLAALCTFLFLREHVESELVALLGAAGLMLSTHVVWFAGTALALAVAVAPLALLGARRIVRAPGVRSATLLGGALLLIVLAGHPESALHLVVLAIAYFAFELVWGHDRGASGGWGTAPDPLVAPGSADGVAGLDTVPPSLGQPTGPGPWPGRRRPLVVLTSGLAAGTGALLLSAVFLLPFFEAVVQTSEYQHREAMWSGRQHVAAPIELTHRILANVMPFLEGLPGQEEGEHTPLEKHGWLATAYAGSLLFAPAIYAVRRVRSRNTWFFLIVALFGVGAGTSAPLVTHLLSVTPGFRFAVNDRMIFYAVLGLCVLAAIGLDAWLRTRDRALAWYFLGTAAALTLMAFVTETHLAPDYVIVNATRAVLPLALGGMALLILSAPKAIVALLALLLVQRAGEAGSLQPTVPRRAFYPPFAGLEVMRANEPFRIVGVGAILPPATSTHYGLEDIRGFEALTLGRLLDTYVFWSVEVPVWSNRVDSLAPPFLDLMNTRFAIAPAHYVPPAWWVRRAGNDAYAILENTRVLPRAFVPRHVVHRATNANVRIDLQLATDFADTAWIESDEPPAKVPNGAGRVTVAHEGSGLRMRATMEREGWIVISNSAWRGWRALVDGKEVPVKFANRAFLAVKVPAGEHDVRLFYRPRGFVVGAWVSGVTALGLVLGLVLLRRGK